MTVLIGCCGAGGTGKTTVVSRVVAERSDTRLVASVVRATMKKLGYENEDAMKTQDATTRLRIQTKLLEAYIENLDAEMRAATGEILLFERTPLDHFAYILYHGHQALDTATFTRTRDMVMEVMRHFDTVFYFPYPTPWKTQPDGFRTLGLEGQNLVHNALVHNSFNDLRYIVKPNGKRLVTVELDDFDITQRLATFGAELNRYRLK